MITIPRPNRYTDLPLHKSYERDRLRELLLSLKGKTFSIDTETTGLEWYREGLIGICLHCPELNLTDYFFTCEYQDLEVPTGRKKKVWTGEYETVELGLQPTKIWTGEMNGRLRVFETRMQPKTKQVKVYRYENAIKIERTAVPIVELQEIAQECLMEVASDPKTTMIFHNSRFDCHFLGLDLLGQPCTVLDTSIMVHLFDSRLRKSLDSAEQKFLRSASKRRHVHSVPKGMAKKHRCWPPEVISEYGRNDALVTFQLAEVLIPKLRKLKLIDLLMCDMEYSKTLWQIERRGMKLNVEFCDQAREAFIANGKKMEEELFDTIGYEFNWRSNPQLSKALYDDMNFPKPINPFADADGVDRSRFAFKGKYNKFCTSAFLLMEKANHPLGGLILDLREADKLRKATENYKELMDRNGYIHTNFNQTGTRTGRLSSSKPNVQNIASAHRVRETQSAYSGGAIRQEEYNLRQAFMARPGYTFVSIDHSQQEQRLFAILANEPAMLEALRNRLDIHLMIALKVWGDCGPERNKLHREWSKTISFGLLYGMTTGSLKFRLNKTEEEANEITDKYWGTFPRVQPWLQETVQQMQVMQRVRYWSGRIWREESPDDYYKGCNAQIQGGAADLIKLAIMRAQAVCMHQKWGSVASIIHDEIMCEVKDEYVEEATPVLVRVMELEDVFGLPFKAEAKIGKTYGVMEDVKVGNVGDIDWTTYLAPNYDLKKLSLTPWEKVYGKEL